MNDSIDEDIFQALLVLAKNTNREPVKLVATWIEMSFLAQLTKENPAQVESRLMCFNFLELAKRQFLIREIEEITKPRSSSNAN